jgi:hypothetical protein
LQARLLRRFCLMGFRGQQAALVHDVNALDVFFLTVRK